MEVDVSLLYLEAEELRRYLLTVTCREIVDPVAYAAPEMGVVGDIGIE